MSLNSIFRSALHMLTPVRAASSDKRDAARLRLIWNGSTFVTRGEAEGDVRAVALWDADKKKATWTGAKLCGANVVVAFDESFSHCGMCEAPLGDTELSRENALRYNLDQEGCAVSMEDALACSFSSDGIKHRAGHLLFAVSKSGLDQLAMAARGLGLRVERAEPWAVCVARGAMMRAGLTRGTGPEAVFVPGESNAWLFVFKEGDLQWMWTFEWGRSHWDDAARALHDTIENFNDRVSIASLVSLRIAHSADDEAHALAAAKHLRSTVPWLDIDVLAAPGSGPSLTTFLALEGLRHA